MNIRLVTLCLGGFLALSPFMAQPLLADEWNKKTEFEFSGPVAIPGKVLPAGKYVFQLLDSNSDRNIVEIFSEDANGKDTLVATLLAIPDCLTMTPDKPIVHFDERPAGTPEAIHSWYYPGENTGWEFVYPKQQRLETSSNVMPAQAPADTAAALDLPPAPEIKEEVPAPAEVTSIEEEVMEAPAVTPDAPALMPGPEADSQSGGESVLPETAGQAGIALIAGLGMVFVGTVAVLASRRKSLV